MTACDGSDQKTRSPLKAIRAKCLDCSGGSAQEVRLCPVKDCPLFAYRMGRGNRKPMSEEQRQAAAERFARIRKEKEAHGSGDEA